MKPCPICGGNAGLSHSWDADGCYWSHVECTACGLRTRGQWTTSRQEASSEFYEEVREAWNSRPAAQQDAPTDAEVIEYLRELGDSIYVVTDGERVLLDKLKLARAILDRYARAQRAGKGE